MYTKKISRQAGCKAGCSTLMVSLLFYDFPLIDRLFGYLKRLNLLLDYYFKKDEKGIKSVRIAKCIIYNETT